MKNVRVAVLSPHRDDAAFSCGLLLTDLLRLGKEISIVNICTVSGYAPYLPAATDDRVTQVTEHRRAEDLLFARQLAHQSAAVDSCICFLDLGWSDVPLRWRMADEHALDATDVPTAEVDRLCEAFVSSVVADVILVPKAIGGHVDHRLVKQAAILAFPPENVVFYQDLPYACLEQITEPAEAPALEEAWLPTLGITGNVKLQFALCYKSQVARGLAEAMEHHAVEHGGREQYSAKPSALSKLTSMLIREVPRA